MVPSIFHILPFHYSYHTLCNWIRWFHQYSTFSLSIILITLLAKQDVSIHSPCLTPRILHFPKLIASSLTITNDQHTMIQSSATQSSQHTTRIELKCRLICFNRNRHRTLSNSCFQISHSISFHITI